MATFVYINKFKTFITRSKANFMRYQKKKTASLYLFYFQRYQDRHNVQNVKVE